MALFQDLIGSSPVATASGMCQVLGNLPQEWMAFPFDGGYPVHGPPQRGINYRTLGSFTKLNGFTLDTEVGVIRDPQGPVSTSEIVSGREWLCVHTPTIWDKATEDEFNARNLRPIGEDDAALFTDLLCKMFDYNPEKRIIAKQVLTHPWFLEETSQETSENAGSAASSVQNQPVRPKPHSDSASIPPPTSPSSFSNAKPSME